MPRTQSLPSPGTNGQESSQWPPDTLAEAFAEKHERAWRYVPDHKEWFMWVPDDENTLRRDKSPWDGGGVWRRDASLQIEDSIRKFCRALGLEVTPRLIGAVERLARSDRRLARATFGSSGKAIFDHPVRRDASVQRSLCFS